MRYLQNSRRRYNFVYTTDITINSTFPDTVSGSKDFQNFKPLLHRCQTNLLKMKLIFFNATKFAIIFQNCSTRFYAFFIVHDGAEFKNLKKKQIVFTS